MNWLKRKIFLVKNRLKRKIFPAKYLNPWWEQLAEAKEQADDIDPAVRQIRRDTQRILAQNHLSNRVTLAFRRDA